MKILFFARRFYPEVGGVEKHVYKVSRELIKRGNQVVVVTDSLNKTYNNKKIDYHSGIGSDIVPIDSKRPVKSIYFNNLNVKKINLLRLHFGKDEWMKKFRIWINLFAYRKLILDADVIHCHDVFYWYFPFKLLFPFKKVYITFHGYESYPLPKKNILLHKLWEKMANGNIIVGKFISKWYGTKPDFVIYGAADSMNDNSAKTTVNNQSAYFIGRLDEQTNILDYAKAVSILRKEYKNFKFLVAGDGKFRKEVESVGRVLGFINHPEEYYKNNRFIFVSRYLAIIEAMQTNKLVFALFDNPIKRDYLKLTPFNNLIITVSNPEELVIKLKYFLENPKKEAALVRKASSWANQQTWDKVTEVYLKLWKEF